MTRLLADEMTSYPDLPPPAFATSCIEVARLAGIIGAPSAEYRHVTLYPASDLPAHALGSSE